jgi:hypothetical protein
MQHDFYRSILPDVAWAIGFKAANMAHAFFVLPLVTLNIFTIVGSATYCQPEKIWKPDVPGTCLSGSFISVGGKLHFSEGS